MYTIFNLKINKIIIEILQMYINNFKYLTSTLNTVDLKFIKNDKIFYILNCIELKTFKFDQIENKKSYVKYHKRRVYQQYDYITDRMNL